MPSTRTYYIVVLQQGPDSQAALRQDGTFHFNLESVPNKGGTKGAVELSSPVPFSVTEPSHFRTRKRSKAEDAAHAARATGKYRGNIQIQQIQTLHVK